MGTLPDPFNKPFWKIVTTDINIRRRLLVTIGLLFVYRLGSHIPLPWVDNRIFVQGLSWQGPRGIFFALFQLLSAGALLRFSVLGLGLAPFFTANSILNNLIPLIPALEMRPKEEPKKYQQKLMRYKLLLTIPFSIMGVFSLVNIITDSCKCIVFTNFGFRSENLLTTIVTLVVMTAGSFFSIWIANLISQYGIPGQGLNILVLSYYPNIFLTDFAYINQSRNPVFNFCVYVGLIIAWIYILVSITQAKRQIPVYKPGVLLGSGMRTLPERMVLPIKLPIILDAYEYASSLLLFPAIIAGLLLNIKIDWITNIAQIVLDYFDEGNIYFWPALFLLVLFFSYFVNYIEFNKLDIGGNLARKGYIIPGVMKGSPTNHYLQRVLTRLLRVSALTLGLLVIFPWMIPYLFDFSISKVTGIVLVIMTIVVSDIFFYFRSEVNKIALNNIIIQ